MMHPLLRAITCACTLTIALSFTHAYAALKNGPMLGAVEMREARIWLQTTEPEDVEIIYYRQDDSANRKSTGTIRTSPDNDHAVTLVAGDVAPGHEYRYEVFINGSRVDLDYATTFKTPPYFRGYSPPPDVSFAVLSGHYLPEEGFEPPYRSMSGNHEIFDTVLAKEPTATLWTGDLVGLREPDWLSASGLRHRYTHSRQLDSLRRLMGSIPQYAVLGAKDIGYAGADSLSPQTKAAIQTFQTYWPDVTTGGVHNKGLYKRARFSDIDLFFLDTVSFRRHRHAPGEVNQILGSEQIDWLINELRNSNASFKIIVSALPVLSPADTSENFSFASSERSTLLDRITRQGINGVFFISGGRNFGEMTKHVRSGGYDIFELTSGPITARSLEQSPEMNYFRVPSTIVTQRHFGFVRVTGPEENRVLEITAIDAEGNTLWTQRIQTSQLR